MSLIELAKELNEKYGGDRIRIVEELKIRTDHSSSLRHEIIEDWWKMIGVNVRAVSSMSRQEARRAFNKGPEVVTPKTGYDKNMLLQKQQEADNRYIKAALGHALYGGMLLSVATKKDVLTSVDKRNTFIKHNEKVVIFEQWIADQLENEKDEVSSLDIKKLSVEWKKL